VLDCWLQYSKERATHNCEMRNYLLIVLSVIRHRIISDSSNIFTGESNHRVCGD